METVKRVVGNLAVRLNVEGYSQTKVFWRLRATEELSLSSKLFTVEETIPIDSLLFQFYSHHLFI